MGLHTIAGSIPFKTIKETGQIIQKLKKDFENRVKIDILQEQNIVYYQSTFKVENDFS
ncbi:hypothetical protein [Metabacillus arenae]|uniref:Uncharacterized protein n=1 Tax=Metabacillus arenae TaxID=2771434 RepID=A0A926N9C9_9BACI|nr:hypothetical protein [Metabacillus arenae]MBD1379139.1 hypothetical protein [Metabacillus arenae]